MILRVQYSYTKGEEGEIEDKTVRGERQPATTTGGQGEREKVRFKTPGCKI